MAEVIPFRALRYDLQRAGKAADLLAPPYDVIDPAERTALEQRSPYNVVRLILPRGDADRYEHAAAELRRWVEEGVLRRDDRPGFYRVHTEFEARGRRYTRRGLLCRIRLHPYEEGVVLPHERTLSGPKLDRLQLKRACRTHLSPIFLLYEDAEARVDALLRPAEAAAPVLQGKTPDGLVHRMWRVDDPEILRSVVAAIAPSKLAIADGHHRYETMLALRGELRAQHPGAGSSVDYGFGYLAGLHDGGIVVEPTHRVLHSLAQWDPQALLSSVSAHFTVETRSGAGIEEMESHVAQNAPCIALVPARDVVHFLALRADADLESIPRSLRGLETALLEHLILRRALGLSPESIVRQQNLSYVHDGREALARVAAGRAQAAFLVNATPVERIMSVAAAGESMPQKSTFFHPKVPTGLVLNPIDPDEDADTLG